MMDWVDFARGTARVQVRGAYPQSWLNWMASQHVPFWDISRIDEMCLEATVYRAHLPACRAAAKRAMCEMEIQAYHGARAVFYGLKRRPILLFGLLLVLIMALWSQQYIWTLTVQGNESIPSEEILRALAELGVQSGTRRTKIDPQRLENRMLDRIPALSWFTVNANSVHASVLVKERIPMPELVKTQQPTNVIASQTGLIERMEVYDGQPVVESGQTVLKGQLLVSGLTASFRATVLHHAMAEVYARTWRSTEIICGKTVTEKTYTGDSDSGWNLIVGNKIIKICGNSGISAEHCDKMITTFPLRLPGGIQLPISLEKTEYRYYTCWNTSRIPDRERMCSGYTSWLRGDMIAGQILHMEEELLEDELLWRLKVTCECTEQIGELSPILIDAKEDERG